MSRARTSCKKNGRLRECAERECRPYRVYCRGCVKFPRKMRFFCDVALSGTARCGYYGSYRIDVRSTVPRLTNAHSELKRLVLEWYFGDAQEPKWKGFPWD